MCAKEEEHNGNTEQEFLGGCILGAVINLLPHIQIIVCSAVELERYASHVVEHNIGAEHVRNVGQSPGCLLGDAGNDVVEDLEANDED